MANTSLNYKIGVDIGELRRSMEEAGTLTRAASRELRDMEAQQKSAFEAMTTAGEALVGFGAATAAALGLSAKAAIDWESAFAGVKKTTNGTASEMAGLEGELRSMARSLPATHDEIAGVAEAAGQLGVKRQDIAAFTKTMIDLGETTNLSADEAATGLAKFSNVTGTAASDVDRLGSVLVDLGNNSATTEADILAMASRLAGAATTANIAAPKVLGMAAALSSVGIEAEAGGTAFSKVITQIEVAVRDGGDSLDGFAEVAGVSAADFKKAYAVDATSGVTSFVKGLGRIKESGGNVFKTLSDLGISEVRMRDALLRSANAGDLLSTSIDRGSTAFLQNTALANEAAQRYATTASQLAILKNQVTDVAISFGTFLLPAIRHTVDVAGDLVAFFGGLPGPVKSTVVALGAAAAVISLVGGAALIAYPKLVAMRAQLAALAAQSGAMGAVAGGASRLVSVLAGPWGLALAGAATALTFWAARSGNAAREQSELRDHVKELSAALIENDGAITKNTRALAASALESTKVGDSGKSVLQMLSDLGISTKDATAALAGNATAAARVDAALVKLRASGKDIYDNTGAGKSAADLLQQAEAVDQVSGTYHGLLTAKNEDIAAAKRQAEATGATADVSESSADRVARALGMTTEQVLQLGVAQDDSATAADGQAAALDDSAESAKDAASAIDDLAKGLRNLNGIQLNLNAANRGFQQSLDDVQKALKDNGTSLDVTTEKGRKNSAALDDQAKASYDLAEAVLRETGSEAAMRDSLVASRGSLIKSAERFGMTRKEAEKYADKVLKIPVVATTRVDQPGMATAQRAADILRGKVIAVPNSKTVITDAATANALAKLGGLKITTQNLPAGQVRVTAQTAAAEQAISFAARDRSTTIRVNTQMNTTPGPLAARGFGYADGGVRRFADGGLEDHTAQIAPAGAWRVWAEPETGGEAYIPLSAAKRSRSVGILAQVADEFGYRVLPQSRSVQTFAAGGFAATSPGSSDKGRGGITVGTINTASPEQLVRDLDRLQWQQAVASGAAR